MESMIDAELLEESMRESIWETIAKISFSCESRVLITFITGIFAFLPLFMNMQPTMDDWVLTSSLRDGVQWYESSIIALTLVAPLLIDLSFDMMNCIRLTKEERNKRQKSKGKGDTEQLTICEKVMMIVGFVVLPIVGCLPRTTANLSLIWLCCRRCQLICVINMLWSSWSRYDPKHWSPRLTTMCIVAFSAGTVLFPFIPTKLNGSIGSTTAVRDHPADVQVAFVFYVLLVLIPCVTMLWTTLRWIVIKRKDLITSAVDATADTQGGTSTNPKEPIRDHEKDMILFPFVFIVSGCGLLIFTAVIVGVYSMPWELTSAGLLWTNLTMIGFELGILNFLMRRTKFEAIAYLYELIDAKKSYVRCVSPHPLHLSTSPCHFATPSSHPAPLTLSPRTLLITSL